MPLVNVIFKTFKEKDTFFNPEIYFDLLQKWKMENKKTYLDEHPYLRLSPVRHEKSIWNPRKKIICLR